MGRINVTSWMFEEPLGSNNKNTLCLGTDLLRWDETKALLPNWFEKINRGPAVYNKLTWLALGGDPAARSHRVEQFTAL